MAGALAREGDLKLSLEHGWVGGFLDSKENTGAGVLSHKMQSGTAVRGLLGGDSQRGVDQGVMQPLL